jgi:hypothetical protein
MTHSHDSTYSEYINAGAISSAEHLLPNVRRHFNIRSAVD